MDKDVISLKNKWNTEKEFYKIKEVGDGVQAFVIDVLQSEVFNFEKGLGSQSNSNRQNEFTLEHSKQGDDQKTRRADVVVFIDSNVVIPIEIEKFENIKAGETQIIAYQRDWDKKYGILTDGYVWRFYNNTKYQIFTLNDLLDKTEEFQSFWNDYIKEDNYYLEFLNPKQDGLFKEKNKPIRVQENNDLFFSETTFLIEKFIIKTQLYEKIKDKKTQTELAYSYLIQFVLVKVLVDSEFEIFVDDYNKKLELIISNLKKSSYTDIFGIIRNLSSAIEKDLYRPFKEDQKFINQRLDELTRKDEKEIGDISIWLDIICYINRFNFSKITNDIFGSIYENYLKELYSEENLGQFFTPPEVVDFMLEEIGWTEEEIRKRASENKDNLSIIDPSCGSGTFLYSATNILMNAVPHETENGAKFVENLVNQNIFGLDVEEFSLYLAEMSMLMRLLPCIMNEKYNNPIDKKLKIFKTKDSIAEFWQSYQVNKQTIENNQNQSLFDDNEYLSLGYDSLIRDETDLKDTKQSILEDYNNELRQRFDFVVGNPPYIGYNECAKRKLLCFEMIKGNIKDSKGNVIKIDLSDVYGVNLHSVPKNPKKYAPKPNIYSFFIALANGLLKKGGKMSYIIPQTLLTDTDYDVMRYHLAKNVTIEKIIIFSCKMFVNRGIAHIKKRDIATSSLILIVQKTLPDIKHKVDILYYEKADAGITEALKDIRRGKNTMKKSILQSELLENVDNWNYVKQGKDFLKFYNFYKKNTEDLSCYYEHKKAKERFKSEFYIDGGMQKRDLQTYIKKDDDKIEIFINENHDWSKYNCIISEIKYIEIKDAIFPQGSQGLNPHLMQYRLIWKKAYSNLVFQFLNRPVILESNFGICFSSNNKNEILFLHSLLNNQFTKIVLKAFFNPSNERLGIIAIKPIKSFIRIPVITSKNQFIKDKIVEQTEKMLALENLKLKDLVSFKSRLAVLPQKFDKIEIKNGFLLCDDVEFEIIDNQTFVEKLIKDIALPISLQSLKDLEAIDFELRDKMKNYIDHLVFALYCNVELDKIEFVDFEKIKQECQKNDLYAIIFE
jgi:hypothetical protein